YLEAAVSLGPENSRPHALLAQARLDRFAEQSTRLRNRAAVTDGLALVLDVASAAGASGSVPAALLNVPSTEAGSLARFGHLTREESPLTRDEVVPGLRHLLAARNRCPLRADVQLRLAQNRDRFRQADPGATYLARVKLLAPSDPDLWYECGLQELVE